MKLSIIPAPWRVTVLDELIPDGQFTESINKDLAEEEYRILITKRDKTIEAGSSRAFHYAHATLAQIRFQCPDGLPLLFIEDKPEVSYRSFMLDCARHFISVNEIKKMLRCAWLFKFNYFHWHLSDDQGFRLESKAFPKLHEEGSMRLGDHFGNFSSEAPEGGYYPLADIKEIVAYADSLGITIVPEIDMPGHTSAILHAYPSLGCFQKDVNVKTQRGIFKDILCVGKQDTLGFVYNLLDELVSLFPGPFIHIGGDEAPKDCWSRCPDCRAKLEKLGLRNFNELQTSFENDLIEYLGQKGKRAIVWNDAAKSGKIDKRAIVQQWLPDKNKGLKKHAELGGEIINGLFHHAYCDYPYALNSLKDIYRLETAPKPFQIDEENAVIGTECLIWTEFIRTKERLEEYAWPRFSASAEAAWCGRAKGTYSEFRHRLSVLFPIFEQYGITAMPKEEWTPGPLKSLCRLVDFMKNYTRVNK